MVRKPARGNRRHQCRQVIMVSRCGSFQWHRQPAACSSGAADLGGATVKRPQTFAAGKNTVAYSPVYFFRKAVSGGKNRSKASSTAAIISFHCSFLCFLLFSKGTNSKESFKRRKLLFYLISFRRPNCTNYILLKQRKSIFQGTVTPL